MKTLKELLDEIFARIVSLEEILGSPGEEEEEEEELLEEE